MPFLWTCPATAAASSKRISASALRSFRMSPTQASMWLLTLRRAKFRCSSSTRLSRSSCARSSAMESFSCAIRVSRAYSSADDRGSNPTSAPTLKMPWSPLSAGSASLSLHSSSAESHPGRLPRAPASAGPSSRFVASSSGMQEAPSRISCSSFCNSSLSMPSVFA